MRGFLRGEIKEKERVIEYLYYGFRGFKYSKLDVNSSVYFI